MYPNLLVKSNEHWREFEEYLDNVEGIFLKNLKQADDLKQIHRIQGQLAFLDTLRGLKALKEERKD